MPVPFWCSYMCCTACTCHQENTTTGSRKVMLVRNFTRGKSLTCFFFILSQFLNWTRASQNLLLSWFLLHSIHINVCFTYLKLPYYIFISLNWAVFWIWFKDINLASHRWSWCIDVVSVNVIGYPMCHILVYAYVFMNVFIYWYVTVSMLLVTAMI